MKKKAEKKLVLAKETLKSLEPGKVREVQGGACMTGGIRSCATAQECG
jgi:hypothetical protein